MKTINFTDVKKMTAQEILKEMPFIVTFNGEDKFKVTPLTWRDPRFPVH